MVDLLYIEHIKQLHWFCSDSGHREAFVYYDGKEYSEKQRIERVYEVMIEVKFSKLILKMIIFIVAKSG